MEDRLFPAALSVALAGELGAELDEEERTGRLKRRSLMGADLRGRSATLTVCVHLRLRPPRPVESWQSPSQRLVNEKPPVGRLEVSPVLRRRVLRAMERWKGGVVQKRR